VAFIVGVPAYGAMTILPIAAHRERLAPILADRWHLAVVAYADWMEANHVRGTVKGDG
jgi:hypothetical protein